MALWAPAVVVAGAFWVVMVTGAVVLAVRAVIELDVRLALGAAWWLLLGVGAAAWWFKEFPAWRGLTPQSLRTGQSRGPRRHHGHHHIEIIEQFRRGLAEGHLSRHEDGRLPPRP
jgi:hypothetical protein